jgi:16S rRNA processing protein RimM
MLSNRLKEIGVITKPHSYRGAVVIRLHSADRGNFEDVKSLFLLIEGRAVPFMVESVDPGRNDTLIVSFTGYETADKMAEFVGSTVLAEEGQGGPDTVPDHNMLLGFSVYNEAGHLRGKILSVSERKHQWLATVVRDDKSSFLLPVHEDLIVAFDEEAKTVVMIIPEGLEDLG